MVGVRRAGPGEGIARRSMWAARTVEARRPPYRVESSHAPGTARNAAAAVSPAPRRRPQIQFQNAAVRSNTQKLAVAPIR